MSKIYLLLSCRPHGSSHHSPVVAREINKDAPQSAPDVSGLTPPTNALTGLWDAASKRQISMPTMPVAPTMRFTDPSLSAVHDEIFDRSSNGSAGTGSRWDFGIELQT